MTYVILTGGIDLAVGSLLAFAAMSGAYLVQALGGDFTMSWFVALVVACVVGTGVGYIHGTVITKFNVPPFIVTLGGMTVWRGATLISMTAPRSAASMPAFAGGDVEISLVSLCLWWFSSLSPSRATSPCATHVMAVRSMRSAATRRLRAYLD